MPSPKPGQCPAFCVGMSGDSWQLGHLAREMTVAGAYGLGLFPGAWWWGTAREWRRRKDETQHERRNELEAQGLGLG